VRVSRASRDYALSLLVVTIGGALVIVGAVFAGLIVASAGCVACALTADGAGA
jgi:ABC-type protease/lipase transport system fused ATPase/permease subunit